MAVRMIYLVFLRRTGVVHAGSVSHNGLVTACRLRLPAVPAGMVAGAVAAPARIRRVPAGNRAALGSMFPAECLGICRLP